MGIKEKMKEQNVTMREMSDVTGLSTALICYIAQGCAMFPTFHQLNLACIRLGCKPADIYPYKDLRRMYPNEVPAKKRDKGNPRIRVDRITAELIEREHGNLHDFVHYLLQKQIRHDLLKEEGHDI